jgi:hypothetical protein
MNRRPRLRIALASAVVGSTVVAAVACNTTLQGTLSLITGPDDGFAQDPKPTSLKVQLIDLTSGVTTTVAEAGLPATNGVTVPPQGSTDVDIVQVTGFDQDGSAVVSGSTIPLALDQLTDITLNLFVQRTGQFSRLPSGDGGTATLSTPASTKPILTTLYSRYLLISDGTGKSGATQLYDTLTWQLLPGPPSLQINPLSVAYVDQYTGADAASDAATSIAAIFSIGAKGTYKWLDLTDSVSVDAEVTFDAAVPAGGALADVAGAESVIDGDDGSVYIVGATRTTGAPTQSVLHVTVTGQLQWYNLNVPRLGAAATYVRTVGLYVFGGNVAGDAGAGTGGELLAVGNSVFEPLTNLPVDTTKGAGAVALLDTANVLLAGGVNAKGKAAPVRMFSVGVGIMAPEEDAGSAMLPVKYTIAQLFGLTPKSAPNGWSAIVVGSTASGVTSAYKLTPEGATLVPFKVPRSHAQAIVLPNNSLALVGGDATTMESFIP